MLLSLLATVTGTFDAISYLGLRRVFVANMTGNTVLLGLHAGQGDWLDALRVAAALAGFTLGVAAGAMLIVRERLRLSTALMAEAIMLALAGVIWVTSGTTPGRGPLYALILLSSVAMGVQSAAIRALEVPGVLTTAITNTMAAATIGLLPGLAPNNAETHPVRLQAAVVATYMIGAGIGGAARFAWGTNAVILPLIAIVLAIWWTAFHGLDRPRPA